MFVYEEKMKPLLILLMYFFFNRKGEFGYGSGGENKINMDLCVL